MQFEDIKLSKHFIKNYRDRVGSFPDKKELLKTIQKAKRFITLNGEHYNTLSLFWNIEKKVVIYVDDLKSVPVTVSVISHIQRKRQNRSNYTPMTMH